MGVRRVACDPGWLRECRPEETWDCGAPEREGGRLWPELPALEGTEATYVAGQAGPPLGREEVLPGLRRTPRERGRERLFVCPAGLQRRGRGRHWALPWYSPLRRAEGLKSFNPNRCFGCPSRWWTLVVLAALPSLGAGGESPEAPPQSWTQLWFSRFFLNAAGYASFMVPGYLLVQYFRRKNYLETGNVVKG